MGGTSTAIENEKRPNCDNCIYYMSNGGGFQEGKRGKRGGGQNRLAGFGKIRYNRVKKKKGEFLEKKKNVENFFHIFFLKKKRNKKIKRNF